MNFLYFQVDWRDTPPSDRATALMYAAAAGHAARDPTDSKDLFQAAKRSSATVCEKKKL